MSSKIEDNSQDLDDLSSMGFAFGIATSGVLDDLSSMDFTFDIDNSGVLDELREFIQKDKDNISKDADEKLSRIGDFLKQKTGVLFKLEDFVDQFYRKLKLKQQGENMPAIKDEDLIEYALEYQKKLEDVFATKSNKDFLRLNYDSSNEKVLDLLYDELYPGYVESPKEDFIAHFKNSATSSLLTWKVTETQFVNLFTSLKFQNNDLMKDLSKHFRNSKGKLFNPVQLSVSKSKSTYTKYKGKDNVERIINSIKKLIENT